MAKRIFVIIFYMFFILTGFFSCVTYTRSNPFNIPDNETNSFVVRVDAANSLEVNGTIIQSNEFKLPKASSYEFKLLGYGYGSEVLLIANIDYEFENGKMYLISYQPTTGTIIRSAFLVTMFFPKSFKIILYEYLSDLKKKKKLKKFKVIKKRT